MGFEQYRAVADQRPARGLFESGEEPAHTQCNLFVLALACTAPRAVPRDAQRRRGECVVGILAAPPRCRSDPVATGRQCRQRGMQCLHHGRRAGQLPAVVGEPRRHAHGTAASG